MRFPQRRASTGGLVLALITGIVMSMAAGGSAQATTPASSPTSPETSFAFHSAKGDFVGGGRHRSFVSPATSITVTGDRNEISMSLSNDDYSENFDAEFGAGAGDTLHPGTYEKAERYPFETGRAPGLTIDGDGRGCNQDFGSFVVNQIAFDKAGNVTMADVSFVQHCESPSAPRLTGTLHYNYLPRSYTQMSQPGDPIGEGVSTTYLNGTSTITVSGDRSSLFMAVSGHSDTWFASLAAPTGENFVLGHTYDATRFGGGSDAKLDVSGDARACNDSTGTLTINKLTVVRGALTRVSATWVQYCDGSTAALTGVLHYLD